MFKDLYTILPDNLRNKLLPIIVSILIKTLLELVGIAAILPVFIILLDSNSLESNTYLQWAYNAGGFTNLNSFLLCLSAIILSVIALRGVAVIYLSYLQDNFLLKIYRHFSSLLLKSYYSKGYLFIKQGTSNHFAFKINSVCYVFAVMVLAPMLAIIADLAVILTILAFILFISPTICLIVVLCAFPMIIIYNLVIKKNLSKYGKLENNAKKEQFSTVIDTFKGYPEMVVNNVYPQMELKFKNGLKTICSNRLKFSAISKVSGLMVELSVISCATILILLQNTGNIDISGTLALFGAGAIKVLPAIKSVLNSWSAIKNNSYSLDTIKEGIYDNTTDIIVKSNNNAGVEIDIPKTEHFESIELKNISFSFPSLDVFKNFSLKINAGQRIGVRGVSGSGKSTLFNILLGLYSVNSGEILLNGKILNKSNLALWHNMAGYVPQDVFILNASIAENIAINHNFNVNRSPKASLKEIIKSNEIENIHFSIDPPILDRINNVLMQAQLLDFVQKLPDGVFTVIGECGCLLSGGQRQRIGIARALFKQPQVLFFDEATSAVDAEMEEEINSSINFIAQNNKNLSIVIIAHRESSLKICDSLIDL